MSEEHTPSGETPELVAEAMSPVQPDSREGKLTSGIALCLSGGGYRAMLFHLGTLWRLNEAGYLSKLARISSVSGGSITSAMLGLAWSRLGFDGGGVARNFGEAVVEPIRALGAKTIDASAVIGGALLPGSIGDRIAAAYRKYLYGESTLQDLPDSPRFVINATNVQSGVLWRFSKPYMRDYRVGEVKSPDVELAVAVGASSAFPPVLSPVGLELDPRSFTPDSGTDLQHEPFTSDVLLTDGGVYDNLGLETAWKRYDTILVSDAGGHLAPEAEPKQDWARHTLRVLFIIDSQVRSLRTRQVIAAFRAKLRRGAYWGIRTNIDDYQLADALPCQFEQTMKLADISTRLSRIDAQTQERLINWGYAVCDAAMRKHVDASVPRGTFPYPDAGVG